MKTKKRKKKEEEDRAHSQLFSYFCKAGNPIAADGRKRRKR
jgi:hypothetical protein